MAKVALDKVGKIYPDGTKAVDDLSLEIGDGEFMVFVGPSGCGKTTALRMVAGLEDISEGTVSIGDRVVNDLPSKDRDIAMVFQNYALYPHMSVADNIGFGLKLRKTPKDEIERRVADAANILGLEDFLNRKPRALSGGQRQRVAMGRAIVREPKVFLMDEPLSNLDAKLRVQMRAEISGIQRRLGVTTVYVTHDQVEAMTMGDRVAVIRRGLLQQVAGPQDLYDKPVNIFVAGFIGSPAMNMFEATLQVSNGSGSLTFGENKMAVPARIFDERPGLASYAGKKIVAGIRPEDIEDADLLAEGAEEAGHTMPVKVDLAESMGSEVNIHFTVQAPPVLTEDTKELAADLSSDAVTELEKSAKSTATKFMARLSPRTSARTGSEIKIALDTARMHFFDLETSQTVWS
ncbi:MAG: sn-glycerol-3-phosphate ABC transporter ATP-binding protein UgpC [Actinomycetota bacterium]